MSRPKSSEPKVKLQCWVTPAEKLAVESMLKKSGVSAKVAAQAAPSKQPCMVTAGGHEPVQAALPAVGAEKNSTATPSVLAEVDGAAAEPLPREYFKKEVERLREQLALQSKRADDLQAALEEEQHANGKLSLEVEQLYGMGGTERQSAYIARLLAKITAQGGEKKEFDQT